MKIHIKNYFKYKLLNTLFFGLSIGSIFIIYSPLEPSIYSFGGIVLAFATLALAAKYKKLMNIKAYFVVLLINEILMLVLICTFLILKSTYATALFIYAGYQITFLFGGYLIRAETIFLRKITLYSRLDIFKQVGYLLGLFISFIFYKNLEYYGIFDKVLQIYFLHWLLIVLQLLVIFWLINSFSCKNILFMRSGKKLQ